MFMCIISLSENTIRVCQQGGGGSGPKRPVVPKSTQSYWPSSLGSAIGTSLNCSWDSRACTFCSVSVRGPCGWVLGHHRGSAGAKAPQTLWAVHTACATREGEGFNDLAPGG